MPRYSTHFDYLNRRLMGTLQVNGAAYQQRDEHTATMIHAYIRALSSREYHTLFKLSQLLQQCISSRLLVHSKHTHRIVFLLL